MKMQASNPERKLTITLAAGSSYIIDRDAWPVVAAARTPDGDSLTVRRNSVSGDVIVYGRHIVPDPTKSMARGVILAAPPQSEAGHGAVTRALDDVALATGVRRRVIAAARRRLGQAQTQALTPATAEVTP